MTGAADLRRTIVVCVLLAAAVAYAIWQVWALRWVTDDAFISFRYAQNLLHGYGLVFNVGERVEGYTNFLWTLIAAFGMRLGVDPVTWAAALGALAYFASAGTWMALSWTLHRRDPSRPFLPLAALCLLVQHDQHVFATCGLETSWVTLFVTLGFVALILATRPRDHYLAGAALTVAALSRPDALVFLVSAVAMVLATSSDRWRAAVRLLAIPVLVYVPYWIWRTAYYGLPFPNTYYAKSGGLAYYEQGVHYLALYLKSYYVLALVPAALAWLLVRSRHSATRPAGSDSRTAWLLLAFLVPYTLYVVRVGGDFMFGRFLLPVAGFGYFALERALVSLSLRRVTVVVVGLLMVILTWSRYDIYTESLIVQGVADEPACYPATWHERAQSSGPMLRSLFEGRDVRVAFTGRYAMWVYYAQPSTAIEAETGLTDTAIAHGPLTARGRPGHEKPASLEYLQSRGVHFLFRPPIESDHPMDRLRVVRLHGFEALMLTYDQALLDTWEGNTDVSFVDFPRTLDRMISDSATASRQEFAELLEFSRGYYFSRQPDPGRRSALERLAGQ